MADGEDDILFRIGFESHPEAGSKLEALAKSVEMTQKRIDQMFTTTADRVAKAAATMTASLTQAGSGKTTSPEVAARQQLKSVADAFTQQADRIVALQTEMVGKLEAIRAKDVASADAHAKRLEAIYASTLQRLNAAVATSQTGSAVAQNAAGSSGPGGVAVSTGTVSTIGGASQLEAMAAARKATNDQIIKNTGELNTALDLAAGHEILTLQERNEGAALFARARQAIMRGEAEVNQQTLQQMQEASRYALEMLKEDLDLIEAAQSGDDRAVVGVTHEQAEQAAKRVKAYYDTVQKGIDQVAADEAKLAAQQAKDMAKQKADQDAANRNRRKLIEASRRLEEQTAKQAEAEAKKQQAEQDAAINRRRKLIENSKNYERQLAREVAEEAIAGYEEETQAATRAQAMVQQGRQRLLSSLEQGASGIGKLARSAVLLGLANGEQMESVIRQLSMVQAGIDLVGGTASAVRGAANAFEGLRLIILGRIAAQRAETAAGQQAIAGSTALQNALRLEALSARDAATAHTMLARARGASGIGVPTSSVGPGSTQTSGRGSFIAGTAGAIAGAGLGAYAGARAGEALGGESGSQIGTVIGTVAGGIIGQVVATKMLAGFAARGAGSIAGAVGGRLMAGAGTLAGAVGASGVGGTGGVATAIGGAGVALGASAVAALASTAFALKATAETIKDARRSGLGGGSQAGSFNDTVGGSRFNPFSVLIAWNQRAELAQNEEKTSRMENALVLFKIEQENLRNLQRIRLDFESQRRGVDRNTQDAIAQDQFGGLRTSQEKMDFTRGMTDQRTLERDQAGQRLMGFMEDDPNTGGRRLADDGGTGEAKQALEDYIAANERLIDSEKQREQLARQIATENRQNTLEEIKGIEDVIRARQKEMQESEKQYMTAKERFGAMNQLDQALALKSLEKARAQGVGSLSKVERERLGSIGTEESQDLVSQANRQSADKAGFDAANRPEFERREAAKRQAQDADIDKLAEKSGQGRDQIEQRLAKPVQVDLVDRTQFEITLNKQDDEIFNRIMEEIKRIRLENGEAMKQRIDQAQNEAIEQEQKQAAANRQNARA